MYMKRDCRVVKLCIYDSEGIMTELFLNELLLKTWCVTYICNNILFCLIATRILCYTKTYIYFFTFIVHVYCIVSMVDAGEVNLVSFYLYNYKCMVT